MILACFSTLIWSVIFLTTIVFLSLGLSSVVQLTGSYRLWSLWVDLYGYFLIAGLGCFCLSFLSVVLDLRIKNNQISLASRLFALITNVPGLITLATLVPTA